MTREIGYWFAIAAIMLAFAVVDRLDEDTRMILGLAVMAGACWIGLVYIVWWIFGDSTEKGKDVQ